MIIQSLFTGDGFKNEALAVLFKGFYFLLLDLDKFVNLLVLLSQILGNTYLFVYRWNRHFNLTELPRMLLSPPPASPLKSGEPF